MLQKFLNYLDKIVWITSVLDSEFLLDLLLLAKCSNLFKMNNSNVEFNVVKSCRIVITIFPPASERLFVTIQNELIINWRD